jgi:hypothetical protein
VPLPILDADWAKWLQFQHFFFRKWYAKFPQVTEYLESKLLWQDCLQLFTRPKAARDCDRVQFLEGVGKGIKAA